MNKKVLIHGCLLGALMIYTFIAWNGYENAQEAKERRERESDDRWAQTEVAESRAETASGMIKVAVPLLATAIYGAILAVMYGLPALAGKVTEGMMGSTAEVDVDPMNEARAAEEDEDYTEAIAIYYQVWLKDRNNRRPLMEIVRIQRNLLESPVLAATTIEEGLRDHEWEPDDAGFLLFRLAEIYEEDLEDEAKVREVMNRVVDELQGTRHAGNAAHRLREMEKG